MNCKSANPRYAVYWRETAPEASGKDNGVDARVITTARGFGATTTANNAAVQRVRRGGELLRNRATDLFPSVLPADINAVIEPPGKRVAALSQGFKCADIRTTRKSKY